MKFVTALIILDILIENQLFANCIKKWRRPSNNTKLWKQWLLTTMIWQH